MCVPARTQKVADGERRTKTAQVDAVAGGSSVHLRRGPNAEPKKELEIRVNDIAQ